MRSGALGLGFGSHHEQVQDAIEALSECAIHLTDDREALIATELDIGVVDRFCLNKATARRIARLGVRYGKNEHY